jgi:magnesium transporter
MSSPVNKKVSSTIGLEPGTIVYVGAHRTEDATIDVIDYTDSELRETRVETVEGCAAYKDSPSITWINVSGIHDVDKVERLGRLFGVHPLILEDIANSGQRPKMEESAEYVFVALKMIYKSKINGGLIIEQVSVLFGKSWVITFQEIPPEDVFDLVRQRLKTTVPRGRFMTADYLAYALIDAVVDNYYLVLEELGERVELLEDDLADHPKPETLGQVRDLRRQLIVVRKAVWPLREVISGLERTETPLIHKSTGPYLRDLYEHTIQAIDTVETFRDQVSGLLDLYHTAVANRTNEIMKILTMIATLFMPLSFLAGVYGMNFDTEAGPFNMPELRMPFGYLGFWLAVLSVGVGLLLYFRRRRWL